MYRMPAAQAIRLTLCESTGPQLISIPKPYKCPKE